MNQIWALNKGSISPQNAQINHKRVFKRSKCSTHCVILMIRVSE